MIVDSHDMVNIYRTNLIRIQYFNVNDDRRETTLEFQKIYFQLAILFTLMLLGYIAAKVKWITDSGVNAFSKFIVKIALPALIISSMIIPLTPEKSRDAINMFLIAIVSYAVVCILAFTLPKFISKDKNERGVYAFSIVFSNSGFMGFPVINAILGKEAIFLVSIHNILFNVLVFTLGIKLIQSGKNEETRFNIKEFLNPGTIASVIGLIIFFTELKVPSMVVETLDIVGGMCTPLSMITIGAMLAALPIKQMFNKKGVYVLSIIRLIIAPVIVFVVLRYILNIQNGLLLGIPVIIAGMPVAANTAIMTKQYGTQSELASQGIFVSTLFSCITIPILSACLAYL